MEWLLKVIMFRSRMAFRWRNRHRRRMTESALRTLRQRIEESNHANVPQYSTIYNVGLFAALVEQDISAYSECIMFASSEWHRQFFARGLAVLLYEAAEDMPQVLGKTLRLAIAEFDDGTPWLLRLNPIASQFNQFRIRRSQFLGEVRNLVSAHRDHNAISQLQLMDGLQAIEVYKLSAEFSAPLRELMNYYIDLLPHMHSTPIMIRQVAKAMEASGALPKGVVGDA